jgi:Fe-S cluster assembly protein SufB
MLTESEHLAGINADYEQRYGFHDAENYLYKAPKGLNRKTVEKISEFKSEPQWMRDFRLTSCVGTSRRSSRRTTTSSRR